METVTTYHVSKQRVKECLESAQFWTDEIGGYGQRMREYGDWFAIGSAALSAITSLSVWSVLAASDSKLAVVAVSSVGVIAAVVAIIPKIKGYGDCANKASLLSPRYAHVKGELIDALEMLRQDTLNANARADAAVKEFEEIKREKDALRPFPDDLEKKRRRLASQHHKHHQQKTAALTPQATTGR